MRSLLVEVPTALMSTCLRIVSALASRLLASILLLGAWFWERDDLGVAIAILAIVGIFVLYGVTEIYRAGRIDASDRNIAQSQRSSRHMLVASMWMLLLPVLVVIAIADYSHNGSILRVLLIAFVDAVIFVQALWNFGIAVRIMRERDDS